MALSTSEFVADSLSASSVGGASGARLVLASASLPDVGAWLVEARLATSPDIVRRGLFVLKRARALICLEGITPGNKMGAIPLRRRLSLDRTSFQPAGPCRPSLASRRRLGLPSQGPPLQNTVVIRQSKTREDRSLFKVLGLWSQLPVRLGVALGNRP